MKRYKNYILGVMTTVAMMLPTSCKDETFEEYDALSDEVTVSFTLSPEAASIKSRSRDGETTEKPEHIGDGSSVDMLIYAVYDKDYNLLMGYSAGSKVDGFDHGEGQTILPVDKFPCTVNLILKRNTEYHIAFWAQSRKTKAYNTADLRKVELRYSEVDESALKGESPEDVDEDKKPSAGTTTTTPNNDELRDVFCRTITITPSGSGKIENNVYLYRPLAQINVGTEGWDYEIINRHATKKYRYSKIRINRVARYLDVVKDSVLTSTTSDSPGAQTAESFAVVDFGYAPIPAYYKMWGEKNGGVLKLPPYPSHTIFDWIHDPNYSFVGDDDNKTYGDKTKNPQLDYDYRDIYGDEEFLRVNLYENSRQDKAKEENEGFTHYDNENKYLAYASLNQHEGQESETFKYLSMCYVLTSSKKDEPTVINNVKVWLATDETGSDSINILDIDHVPAQRNWRTNIVGKLLTEQKTYEVKLDNNFAGEFTGKEDWSGPLAKGVYYNAEENVIEISDVDGLLWFQRMVNGDMKVRFASHGVKPSSGSNYRYYKPGEDTPKDFIYRGIDPPTDPKLKERILIATHEYTEKDGKRILNNWPKESRFHFEEANTSGSAVTVKLMADIDLAGIEWIPIGMDYKVAEFKPNYYTKNGSNEEGEKDNQNIFTKKLQTNRGFFGTFDGNGHTIYNMSTKRFGARVDDEYIERRTDGLSSDFDNRNYDAFPWMGRGLFGEIGGAACIKNVRLVNVDVYGCHGVGGIVGIVWGNEVKIYNCTVDGGTLTATPLYRNEKFDTRSFARGTYLGGIVGYFSTKNGELKNCEVKNLLIKGYRQVGGLIGTLDIGFNGGSIGKETDSNRHPATNGISGNSVSNTIIIASQMHFPFGASPLSVSANNLGFGYDGNVYDLYSGILLGGDTETVINGFLQSYFDGTNTTNNVTFAPMKEEYKDSKIRIASIAGVPLEYMPPLSSWFADSITVNNNIYGAPSAYNLYNTFEFDPSKAIVKPKVGKFTYPMQLPTGVEFVWDTESKSTGLYVESVCVDGKNGIGGRSVVTSEKVSNVGESCMFVTARDRKNAGDFYFKEEGSKNNSYAKPTKIYNFVLRGAPYAWAGMLISPNENMDSVVLNSVNIYDVYKTIAMDDSYKGGNYWPNAVPSAATVDFKAIDCNLRGFTELGNGWKSITFNHTTFEEGTFIRAIYTSEEKTKESYTYKVDNDVTFNHCYFKAPFRIEIGTKDDGSPYKVTFDAANSPYKGKKCQATSTSPTNKDLTSVPDGCRLIEITSSPQGDPIVTYYDKDHKAIKL
ncbi:MAG: hypothetical protein J1E99_07995 [Muribaculaceae bacterium]|nr:hypothetical protein [Muribaculaceae bacterium]